MATLIAVDGIKLQQSDKSHRDLVYAITPTLVMASSTDGNGSPFLIEKITLECDCSGKYTEGETFIGKGKGEIVADTARVKCEGKSIFLKGDYTVVRCSGTKTNTASGAIAPGEASVTVTIQDVNQANIFAAGQ